MLQVQLTVDDYLAANYLHARWTRARWIRAGLIVAALIAFSAWQAPGDPVRFGAIMIGIYAAFMILVVVLTRYWYMPRTARRIFAQTKSLQRPYRWSWNAEQLNYSSDLANAIVPWGDLVKWREGDQIFLIYPSNLMFYVFPKRAFQDAAAVDAFRQLLRAKIASPPRPEAAF